MLFFLSTRNSCCPDFGPGVFWSHCWCIDHQWVTLILRKYCSHGQGFPYFNQVLICFHGSLGCCFSIPGHQWPGKYIYIRYNIWIIIFSGILGTSQMIHFRLNLFLGTNIIHHPKPSESQEYLDQERSKGRKFDDIYTEVRAQNGP